MNKALAIFIALIIFIIVFFLLAWIIQVSWNGFYPATTRERNPPVMTYDQAVALTIFIAVAGFVFFGGIGLLAGAAAYSRMPDTETTSVTSTTVKVE